MFKDCGYCDNAIILEGNIFCKVGGEAILSDSIKNCKDYKLSKWISNELKSYLDH